jgi:hypothetical protein
MAISQWKTFNAYAFYITWSWDVLQWPDLLFTLREVEMFYSDQTYFLRFYVAIKTFKNSEHSKKIFIH